ncbi:BolA family protein [Spiribacter salinus]|jgi:acid stress-induced BolA-like protein IbaG/YrbA|nr:BolA/IbaG family iron-sulfur metabolism protein [Spiribacter salinus]MDR9413794.1 BolA/IbaG family iron-sulfur metabolism protein [Spiribacter sp.]MDR9454683.1 BolA/IbaG family iron-sulfur metabolism protein [Spiribacter sp.]TQE99216.1 MAG: BolA/IbaG family iron-sulfur metabolism protein [Spiribacter salinus]
MMEPEAIRALLQAGLTDADVEVVGDGRHFQARIVSSDFEDLPLLRRHRLVYDLLQAHIDSDVLHAISMRTLTPAQAAAEQD